MKQSKNAKKYKKVILILSICALIVWTVLGTGTSLAWFTDITPEVNNIFHFADFDLEVYHEVSEDNFEKIEADTKVFDQSALYEPGYVQVIYLKVLNNGDLDFDFKTAVNVTDYTPAINYFGNSFNLQDYLKFGVMTSYDLSELKTALGDREKARAIATRSLNNYSTEVMDLKSGKEAYIAIVVQMPEEVDNVANYRKDTIPEVELGIIVSATQKTK